jgi:hypothetical protein
VVNHFVQVLRFSSEVLDRIGGPRPALSPAWIRREKTFMKHEYITVIDTRVVQGVERLKHRLIGRVALNEANIALRCSKGKKPLNRRSDVCEGVVRPTLRRVDEATQASYIELAVDHLVPQVFEQFGLGSH